MTKLKKLLLTLAPISAVMIATPIILTSCSTNAEQNNGGSTGGGSQGGGSDTGGSGGTGGGDNNGGGNNTNPTLSADSTNSKDFKPNTANGLFLKVEDVVKKGKPTDDVNAAVDKAFGEYQTLSDKDIIDSINIWSNNKWIGSTKNQNITYTSKIEKISATSTGEANAKKWTIDFTYKFQISTKVGDKTENVLAEKTYSVKDSILATNKGVVEFTTKPTLLMVDGKSLLEDKGGKTFFSNKTKANEESKVIQDVKKFLNDGKSTFNAKENFKEFITNHGIKGEQVQTLIAPVWDEAKVKNEKGVITINESKPTEAIMTLTDKPNAEWGSCVSTTSYQVVVKTFSEASNNKYQTKFKNLVNTGDYDISAVKYGPEIKGDKLSDMDITIEFQKKSTAQGNDEKPTLTLKIKGFAKTA